MDKRWPRKVSIMVSCGTHQTRIQKEIAWWRKWNSFEHFGFEHLQFNLFFFPLNGRNDWLWGCQCVSECDCS